MENPGSPPCEQASSVDGAHWARWARWAWLCVLPFALGACGMFTQDADQVLVRDPGRRTYHPPAAIVEYAPSLVEYAILSENVYFGDAEPSSADGIEAACASGRRGPLPLPGWQLVDDFPSETLLARMAGTGLYVQLWKKDSPPVVAVVFKGTQPNSPFDWVANTRWILRFVPFYRDQYVVVAEDVAAELVARLADNPIGGGTVTLVATGHSLGGGLAQHLAYALPVREVHAIRVSEVYAFNPSPVTGWYSVDTDVREANAVGLQIVRVFEHGEVLAYLRLLTGYFVPPSESDPSIQQMRVNFDTSLNPLHGHSMRLLACGLMTASDPAGLRRVLETFN